MTTYRCTGHTAAADEACDFTTTDAKEAMDHFEATDHDVDEVADCAECGTPFDGPGKGRKRGVAYQTPRGPVHFPACLRQEDRDRLRATIART